MGHDQSQYVHSRVSIPMAEPEFQLGLMPTVEIIKVWGAFSSTVPLREGLKTPGLYQWSFAGKSPS
jgi:hypothetical protein